MDWRYESGRVYSTDENGALLAEATFVPKEKGEVVIDHTYVSPALRGQGLASKLMAAVADHLLEQGLTATATCSYAHAWLEKNRQNYPELVADDLADATVACKIDGRR